MVTKNIVLFRAGKHDAQPPLFFPRKHQNKASEQPRLPFPIKMSKTPIFPLSLPHSSFLNFVHEHVVFLCSIAALCRLTTTCSHHRAEKSPISYSSPSHPHITMGFRSSICQIGKRLLAALTDSQNIYEPSHDHYYYNTTQTPTPTPTPTRAPAHPSTHSRSRSHVQTCRVCAVQQASRMSESLVCHSHRINQQLTARPLPPLPTTRPLPALPSVPSSHRPSTLYTTHRREDSGGHSTLVSPSSYASSSTLSLVPIEGAQGELLAHNHSYARLVTALQAALQNVRYAVTGPLALRLIDPLWYIDIGEPLDGSIPALQPTIACPLATRDVLSSWAAASQNAFKFDRRRPYRLQLSIDGRYVNIRIEWVADQEFDSGEGSFYQIDRTEFVFYINPEDDNSLLCCSSPYGKRNTLDIVSPVLTLPCLLQHMAKAYTRSGNADPNSMEHKVLGHQVNACLGLLGRSVMYGSRFLMSHEVPAVYDPEFSSMYFTEFGAEGVQRLHAVCAGIPSLCAPQTEKVSKPTSSNRAIARKPIQSSSQPKASSPQEYMGKSSTVEP